MFKNMHYILYRLCVQRCRFYAVTSQKLFSTVQKQQFISKKEIQTSSKKLLNNRSVLNKISNFLNQNDVENYINILPKNLIKKSRGKGTELYLINPEIAKKLGSMISEDLQQNTAFVIECNPGVGLLTKELLKAGIPSIHLYEDNEVFLRSESPLNNLILNYKTHLHLQQLNFFDIWLLLLHDKHYKDSLADVYLENAPYHNWKNNTFAQIISLCSDRKFISLLIHNFVNQTNIFHHGRPTFYIGLPSLIWKHFTATKTSNLNDLRYYTQYNVILHLFFEFYLLDELPRKAFLPEVNKKTGIKKNESIIFIKLEPKRNTFNLIRKKDLKTFWFFLKYCMRSRKNKVISELEKISPGCGPKLIEQNIDICTGFKDLEPKMLLTLFKRLKTWPEYNESIFLSSSEITYEIKKEEDKNESEEQEQENSTKDLLTQFKNLKLEQK